MENILGVMAGIMVAAIISALIMAVQKKKRNQSWSGVVTDIRRLRDVDTGRADIDQVRIKYRRDDGKKGKLMLDEHSYNNIYSTLKIGDRLEKEAGADYPHIQKDNQ